MDLLSEIKKRKQIKFATSNIGKLAEIKSVLSDFKVENVNLENLPEIQSLDPEEVAIVKAQEAYYLNSENPVFVDDTSLSINSIEGLPGTFADFFTSTEMKQNITGEFLQVSDDRSAVARVVLSIFLPPDNFMVWKGEIIGEISEEPIGDNGFGWDDIFIPLEFKDHKGELNKVNPKKNTYAQMSSTDKLACSPRTIALTKLAEDLK